MASIRKSNGRKPIAVGKVFFGWTRAGDAESYQLRMFVEEGADGTDRSITLTLSKEEIERLVAYVQSDKGVKVGSVW